MSDEGNIYWASFRAACYAAAVLLLASKINGCIARNAVRSHNCAVKWSRIAQDLSKSYQTNVVVREIKVNDSKYYDFNSTKLLLYKEADMKFGPGMYVMKIAEYEPCRRHGSSARVYYTVEPKKEN